MKKLLWFAAGCLGIALTAAAPAQAQRVDAAFGGGTLLAPTSSSASGGHAPQTMAGGFYPDISADFFIRKHLGVNFNISWRSRQNFYQGFQPYRPLLYDLNAVWLQRLKKSIFVEVFGGVGAQQTTFYTPVYSCSFASCTNFSGRTDFMGDVGGGVRYYIKRGLFVRPEAQLYLIHANADFSASYATRVGVSIGYAIGPR